MKKSILYLTSLFLVTCCTQKQTSFNHIDLSFSKLTKQKISNSVKSYTIIPLETREDSYFTTSKKIKFSNGMIYILNSILGKRHQILIFDSKGIFHSKINSQGRGPKEYLSISDFDINPTRDIISILDPGSRKLINYHLNSEYQDEQKLNFYAKEFKYSKIGNRLYKVFVTYMSKLVIGENYDIYVYDENNKFIYSSLPFKHPMDIVLGNGINLMSTDSGVSYHKPNSDIIYKIGYNSTKTKFKLTFPSQVLPSEKIEKTLLRGEKSVDKFVYNINYFETSRMVIIQFMYKHNVYCGIYDKESKKSILFEDQKDPSCGCGITLNIKGVSENSFIIETDYLKIEGLLKILDPELKKCFNPGILEARKTWDITSNPILLLVDFEI
jgi:hypothetical protein